MKKTLLALSLIGCLLFSATSCTNSGKEENHTADSAEATNSEIVTPEGSVNEEESKEPDGSGEQEPDSDGHSMKKGGGNIDSGWDVLHPID